MKKSTFLRLLLILLPILAVGLATTGDSVRVFDQSGQIQQFSYFDLAEVGAMQMAMPTAAILSLVSGILAAVYLGAKKSGCLKGIVVTAFLASTLAVLPVLAQGAVRILPNPMLPIFMLVEAVLAYTMVKKPVSEEKSGPRLDGAHL